MSRIYEALKRAEKERNKETTRLKVSTSKPVNERKIEDEKEQLRMVCEKEEVIKGQDNDFLITLQDPLSQPADQFMKVCVRLVQQGQHDKRVILVTSPLPQEGKTIATANLAIGLARLPDTHVSLIDADLRKPRLHQTLDISVDKGLSEYLEGRANISEIYYDTPVPRLFIIPGGEAQLHPERILSADKVQRLLEKLQAKHPKGYIIIDSAPMLLSVEPEILLNYVDSLIMVVRYGRTRRDSLQKALDLLDKRKVMGIIFNQVDGFFTKNDYYHSPKENIHS